MQKKPLEQIQQKICKLFVGVITTLHWRTEKMSVLSKLIYRLNVILSKTHTEFLVVVTKLILWMIWNKEPSITKIVLQK